MQERAQDRSAALDQVRAQKAFEKAEIEERTANLVKKARHVEALKKLHLDRQVQFADNDRRLKTAQTYERIKHVEVIDRLNEQEKEERVHMATRRNAFLSYKQQLNKQMAKNSEVRQHDKHAQIIEGKKNRLDIDH